MIHTQCYVVIAFLSGYFIYRCCSPFSSETQCGNPCHGLSHTHGAPAATASFKPGRSGSLEPEVEDEKGGKNGLQARGRSQGNSALKSDKRALSRST